MEPISQVDQPTVTQTKVQEKVPILKCKSCHSFITQEYYFCPTCGKKIKEPPFRFSWAKTTGIMIFSILFPPLGIFPGIKYLKIPDRIAKIIGLTAILITIIFTIAIFVFFMNFINSIYGSLDSINQTNYLLKNSVQNQAEELYNLN